MNTKTSMIILGVIGSITGLCFAANYCLTIEPETIKDKAKAPDAFTGPQNQETPEASSPEIDNASEKHYSPEPEREITKEEKLEAAKTTVQPRVEVDRVPLETSPPVADEFPLRVGSKGPRVERLQVWLMRNYGRTGIVTGNFTEETEAELKKRLHKNKLDEGTYQRYRMGKHVHEQVFIR
jgi:hypothetical protein